MAKVVAKTYGEALLQIACDKNMENQFIEELTSVLEIIKENEGFSSLMNHPEISKEEIRT